ncbi:MAG: hypothetical protein ACAF41_11830 [Leptolyngbya sp. BL-A-14]
MVLAMANTEDSSFKQMLLAIQKLPTTQIQKDWSFPQKKRWGELNNTCGWWAARLDYLQAVQTGYLVSGEGDPCKDEILHPALSIHIKVTSDWYFSILQLLVCDPTREMNGFVFARETARNHGRAFPFTNPREMLVEIIADSVESEVQEFLIGTTEDSKMTLAEMQSGLRFISSLYRDRADPETVKAWLEQSKKEGGWLSFLIASLWEQRYRAPIRPYWKSFLCAQAAVCAHYCKSKKDEGYRLILPLWRGGQRFDTKNHSPLPYPKC